MAGSVVGRVADGEALRRGMWCDSKQPEPREVTGGGGGGGGDGGGVGPHLTSSRLSVLKSSTPLSPTRHACCCRNAL
ncbi:hypothetical protein E2C01_093030 [Portunus trituberculatus]|uniref:Uncharacterized protein n=1 Tax=Portunus trituberculatus TaxID=210409 RepID=A0A5B7JZH4_PORTR|nr:hypothetical protein [Portunus trituberculatus]